jgi:hypothetical protein
LVFPISVVDSEFSTALSVQRQERCEISPLPNS